jgi:hypothetical protein
MSYGMSSNKRSPESDNEESNEEELDEDVKELLEANALMHQEFLRLKYAYLRSLTDCAARKRIPKSLQQKWVAEVYKKLDEIDICSMKDILMHITEINEWLICRKMLQVLDRISGSPMK